MFTTTISQLRNTITVAIHTMEPQNFNTKISNAVRDIYIEVTYFPEKNIKEDIYPYWHIDMVEEEWSKKLFVEGRDLKQVRDIYNGFVNQGEVSFLENYNPS